MRVRYLMYGGLLAIALFANLSFAAAHGPGATNDPVNQASAFGPTSVSTQEVPLRAMDWAGQSVSAKFVTMGANLPAIDVAQKFAVSAPVAGNDGGGGQSMVVGQGMQGQEGHNSLAQQGSMVVNLSQEYDLCSFGPAEESHLVVIVGRTGLSIATASTKPNTAPDVLSNYSGLTQSYRDQATATASALKMVSGAHELAGTPASFGTAAALGTLQISPRFVGLQRTEHIASAAAAKFGHLQSADNVKESAA